MELKIDAKKKGGDRILITLCAFSALHILLKQALCSLQYCAITYCLNNPKFPNLSKILCILNSQEDEENCRKEKYQKRDEAEKLKK